MTELQTARTVEVVAAEINALTASMLGNIVEIGRRMCEAKEMLPYGTFGTWIKENTGYSTSTANNFMRLFQEYGSPQGCLFGAQVECQTFGKLSYATTDCTANPNHVGIVEAVSGNTITVIEGNKGEAVARRTVAVNGRYIRGYCLPDYASKAEEEDDMDQTKFNEMFKTAMTEYRKELQDNDCGEWSEEAREWAISVGLFAGNGTTVDGKPNYMWKDFLTREQAAKLFYRFAKEHGIA